MVPSNIGICLLGLVLFVLTLNCGADRTRTHVDVNADVAHPHQPQCLIPESTDENFLRQYPIIERVFRQFRGKLTALCEQPMIPDKVERDSAQVDCMLALKPRIHRWCVPIWCNRGNSSDIILLETSASSSEHVHARARAHAGTREKSLSPPTQAAINALQHIDSPVDAIVDYQKNGESASSPRDKVKLLLIANLKESIDAECFERTKKGDQKGKTRDPEQVVGCLSNACTYTWKQFISACSAIEDMIKDDQTTQSARLQG